MNRSGRSAASCTKSTKVYGAERAVNRFGDPAVRDGPIVDVVESLSTSSSAPFPRRGGRAGDGGLSSVFDLWTSLGNRRSSPKSSVVRRTRLDLELVEPKGERFAVSRGEGALKAPFERGRPEASAERLIRV